jgi:hypothetical protein
MSYDLVYFYCYWYNYFGKLMVSGASQLGGGLIVTGGSISNQGITTGAVYVTGRSAVDGSVSAGFIYAPLATISNIVATASSSGTFNVSNVTAASVFVDTTSSSANVYAPLLPS